jgi:diamine N-acetyltransferase
MENIKIRAFKEDDIWILHKWINDPEIIQFTNYYRPISEMEQKDWFEAIHKNKNQFVFGIEELSTNKLIGTCGLYDYDSVNSKAELRMKIGDKSQWGKGYGKIALNQLLDFGFQDLNLHRIWLKVLEDNEAAVNLYKKFNFVIEGNLKDDMFIKGHFKNVILMGLIK